MLSFCGIDKCLMDSNGRVKLSPRVLDDFAARGGDVVLRCLPEGSVAVYPEEIYLEMRKGEVNPAERAGQSMLFRRTLRSFGAMSQSEKISAQGRVTLPPTYREHAGLKNGGDAMVVGVEIGIEIWSCERWNEEQRKIQDYMMEKGEREMASSLADSGETGGKGI